MKRPPLADPAMLLATAGGTGLLPRAPGTWGSLLGVGLAWLIVPRFGGAALIAICLALFLAGWWSAERVIRASENSDPAFVVIDEVVGQAVALAVIPPSLAGYVLGFLLFRLFDIWKPWPIGAVDRKLRNGFGVMIDDLMAAGYVMIIFYLSMKFLP